MTILSPTNLETANYNAPGWSHIFNKNIDLLNLRLLRITGLVDVEQTQPEFVQHGVLVWHSGLGKWRAERFSV